MGLLIPLYLGHQGHSVGAIGIMAGIGGIATLLSRFPVPAVYRPERSVFLLVVLSAVGAVTAVALPLLSDLVLFGSVFFLNRAASGAATAIYLARFLDSMDEHTDRRKAMGFYGGTQAVGYATSNLFIGLLADFLGYTSAFLYGGAISAVAGILLIGTPTPMARRGARARAGAPERPTGLRGRIASVADPGLWGVLNTTFWNTFFHTVQSSFFPVLGLAVGLTPGQIGVTRSVYAGVNAVGRPAAGLVMHRLTLRQVNYLGMIAQAIMLFALPFMREFALFLLFSLAAGLGRAVVVVATSAALAEEVDETRVSRGVSTAAYSTAFDLPNSVGPVVGGFVATLLGVTGMFPVMAAGALAGFLGGDAAMSRWRTRRVRARDLHERQEAGLL
jgi:predicted MFS family arabinose efflux permease